jgi:carbonic anhydrase
MDRRSRTVAVAIMLATLFLIGATVQRGVANPSTPSKTTATKTTKAVTETPTPEPESRTWATLMAGNRRFVRGEHLVRPTRELRSELAKGQHPDVIVLTCSDSRLSPEWIFDQPLGEVFVVRTAGNLVDPIALGSIEYAVEHLHAKLLVVMGHDKCGAVDAALGGGEMPTDNLKALVAKIRPGLPPTRAGASAESTLQSAVEANVRRSATDCIVGSPIVREATVKGSLAVVQAVYHLSTGEVEELRSLVASDE